MTGTLPTFTNMLRGETSNSIQMGSLPIVTLGLMLMLTRSSFPLLFARQYWLRTPSTLWNYTQGDKSFGAQHISAVC